MNVRFHFVVLLSVAMTSFGLLTGCGQGGNTGSEQDAVEPDDGGQQDEGVNPHDVPLTDEQKQRLREETAKFADAVARIRTFRDTVQEETRDGLPENPFEAHQALDRCDLVVQWLPGIARDSSVPKEHWETISTTANELRELFDTVHQNIDNKVDPGFTSVEQQMDAKIAELEAIAQQQTTAK